VAEGAVTWSHRLTWLVLGSHKFVAICYILIKVTRSFLCSFLSPININSLLGLLHCFAVLHYLLACWLTARATNVYGHKHQQYLLTQSSTVSADTNIDSICWHNHRHIPHRPTHPRVTQLVEKLRSKPEGRGFDSRWCHWNFHLHHPSSFNIALGSSQPLTEMSTRNISWGVKTADA
jgi:hypothetical protein